MSTIPTRDGTWISDLEAPVAAANLDLEEEVDHEINFGRIVGRSPALRRALKQIETVSGTVSTVILEGETGTGKELLAQAIHDLSGRRSGPFVKINCAAIPGGLLESELFGHEKGAFTSAWAQRVGRFELANGGTILLDEVGEISLELQPKFLRVLQEREFERLGGTCTLHADIRVIAATNRDLIVERAVILSAGPVLEFDIGDLNTRESPMRRAESRVETMPLRKLRDQLEEAQRDAILHALRQAGGRVGGPDGAADRLGLKRTTLIGRMKRLGIESHSRAGRSYEACQPDLSKTTAS